MEDWRGGGRSSSGDARTEAANSLMALLGCSDIDKMSRTLLAMSSSPANCDMMRGSRCIPLLVQLLHLDPAHPANPRPARPVRARAARSLHNIVHAHPTDKHCKREAKVLKLLEVLRQYSDFLRDVLEAVRIFSFFASPDLYSDCSAKASILTNLYRVLAVVLVKLLCEQADAAGWRSRWESLTFWLFGLVCRDCSTLLWVNLIL